MAEVSADKIIGKTLWAKKEIIVLDSSLNPVSKIASGNVVGVVQSYIERPGHLYWIIKSNNNKAGFFIVEHKEGNFSPNKGGVQIAIKKQQIEDKAEIQKADAALEELKKEEKGAVAYYVEKYGPWIIGTVVLLAIIKKKL
jgi:hypothetical protein